MDITACMFFWSVLTGLNEVWASQTQVDATGRCIYLCWPRSANASPSKGLVFENRTIPTPGN